MVRVVPFLLIFLATAIPAFIIMQAPRTQPGPPVTIARSRDITYSAHVQSAQQKTAILELQYQPLKNRIELVSTSFADGEPPPSPKAPWQREGKFVLKIEHMTATGAADYVTWTSVDAVKQLWDAQAVPTHTLSITVPYQSGSSVRILEPTSLREYARFLLP